MMTKEENMKKLSLLERNARGGMWDKLVDDLDESRLRYPRPRLSHAVREYMAESVAARPVYGLHQLARLSELMLHHVTVGSNRNPEHLERVECLFIDVRTAIRGHIERWPRGVRPDRKSLSTLRTKVKALLAEAREVYYAVKGTGLKTCPCCHGRGRVAAKDLLVIRDAVAKLVAEGLIDRKIYEHPIMLEKHGDEI
jgi:hypothetical protein